MTGVAAVADMNDWTNIAGVSGTDRITQIHIRNLLLYHNIESGMEGSLMYDVSVPSAKAEEATKLLRADAPKTGYSIWFGSNDVVKATGPKAIINHVSVSAALQQPEFADSTALGKFLRSKELVKLPDKYPYIISLSVHERRYLATPQEYGTGYDIEITLQKSLREQDDGYHGYYQVYGDGQNVGFLGSNEWKVGAK